MLALVWGKLILRKRRGTTLALFLLFLLSRASGSPQNVASRPHQWRIWLWLRHEADRSLLRALTSPWLHDQLASLPGYSVTQCGERLATIDAAGRGAPDPIPHLARPT